MGSAGQGAGGWRCDDAVWGSGCGGWTLWMRVWTLWMRMGELIKESGVSEADHVGWADARAMERGAHPARKPSHTKLSIPCSCDCGDSSKERVVEYIGLSKGERGRVKSGVGRRARCALTLRLL